MDGDSFGSVLRSLREGAHLSQSAVARRAGLDPSFVNRLESGQRNAERSIAERLAQALELEPAQADRLLAAGGYLPTLFARVGLRDPTLEIVARILGDESLSPNERDDFREIIRLIGTRWLRRGPDDCPEIG
ncbi:MAG: helix-turn-helix domain-containing protein [Chloroflexota bacterium]